MNISVYKTKNSKLLIAGDFQSSPGRPFEEVNARIDQLTSRLSSLEHTMASDIRLILHLLQQKLNSKESSSLETMSGALLGGQQYPQEQTQPQIQQQQSTGQTSLNSYGGNGRPPALSQRSASEPQPVTPVSLIASTTSAAGNSGSVVNASRQTQQHTLASVGHGGYHGHFHTPSTVLPSTSHGYGQVHYFKKLTLKMAHI